MLKFILLLYVEISSFTGWKLRCAQYFPCSTYFEGKCSSAASNSVFVQIAKNPENRGPSHSDGGEIADFVESNGKLEAFKDLNIWTWGQMNVSANMQLQFVLVGRSDHQVAAENKYSGGFLVCCWWRSILVRFCASHVSCFFNFLIFTGSTSPSSEMHFFANVYNILVLYFFLGSISFNSTHHFVRY